MRTNTITDLTQYLHNQPYKAQKNENSIQVIKNNNIGNQEIKVNKEVEKEIIKAIEKANGKLELDQTRLEFSIHDKTKQVIVKVIDTKEDKIIREIPSEKILDMVAKLCELAGIYIDEKR